MCAVPTYAFFNSDVKKAKEFIQAGMYPQAIELLNKHINEKPTDSEAHYLLGKCYLRQSQLDLANNRYQSAAKLDHNYNVMIATDFRELADKKLESRDFSAAIKMYSRAIQFQPEMKESIAQYCFNKGSGELSTQYFDIAVSIDQSFKIKSFNLIMDKAESTSGIDCLPLYSKASIYLNKNSERGQKAGYYLLSRAKELEEKDRFDERISKYKKVAGYFVTVPPDYELITKKFFGIKITDGNPTKFYKIQYPKFKILLGDDNYYLETFSGRIIRFEELKSGKTVYFNEEPFRIVPIGTDIVEFAVQAVE